MINAALQQKATAHAKKYREEALLRHTQNVMDAYERIRQTIAVSDDQAATLASGAAIAMSVDIYAPE